MQPASRRIFLYWLLLLVPTLMVGGGAIQLLRREQARLVAQGAYAREAREAAVAARARLIVENAELLVGDVETGLLDTLAREPADTLESFMRDWESGNPLVRVAFLAAADGRLLRPAAREASEELRGFARRFGQVVADSPPWSLSETTPESPTVAAPKDAEPGARKEIALNVAQVQSARRDVQTLLKARPSNDRGFADNSRMASAAGEVADSAPAAGSPLNHADAALMRQRGLAEAEWSRPGAAREQQFKDTGEETLVRREASKTEQRRGWVARTVDQRLHLIGWLQSEPGGEIRGVEAELAALVSRLAGALPAELAADEGYALLDEQGRVVHQVGKVARAGVPAVQVPLAASLLPGWSVVAYLSGGPTESRSLAGLFWLSVLLVGLFIVAILTGGSLLFRQARRSEADAAQKTSFVANVSHEFKTPLTTIRLYAELLEQGRVHDAAKGADYLRTIGRETQRLTRLINNVLDFSRLEQGRKKFACEPVDLHAILSRLLETQEPRLAEAGLKLETAFATEALSVTADRDALEQILLNLLDNACKYAAAGGTVTVTSRRASGRVEVSVADRGSGVPAEQREKIFERFHRVDDSLRAEKTGAGLGLSIARQLARGMGGDLRYESRVRGGSEFILQLP